MKPTSNAKSILVVCLLLSGVLLADARASDETPGSGVQLDGTAAGETSGESSGGDSSLISWLESDPLSLASDTAAGIGDGGGEIAGVVSQKAGTLANASRGLGLASAVGTYSEIAGAAAGGDPVGCVEAVANSYLAGKAAIAAGTYLGTQGAIYGLALGPQTAAILGTAGAVVGAIGGAVIYQFTGKPIVGAIGDAVDSGLSTVGAALDNAAARDRVDQRRLELEAEPPESPDPFATSAPTEVTHAPADVHEGGTPPSTAEPGVIPGSGALPLPTDDELPIIPFEIATESVPGLDTDEPEEIDPPPYISEVVPLSEIDDEPPGLSEDEPPLGDMPLIPTTSTGPTPTDDYIDTTAGNSADNTDIATVVNQSNVDVQQASNTGNADRNDARNIRNQAGGDANTSRRQSVSQTAGADANNSWGQILGNAVETIFTVGATEVGTSFGAEVGSRASDGVFGPDHEQGEGDGGDVADTSDETPQQDQGDTGQADSDYPDDQPTTDTVAAGTTTRGQPTCESPCDGSAAGEQPADQASTDRTPTTPTMPTTESPADQSTDQGAAGQDLGWWDTGPTENTGDFNYYRNLKKPGE